MKKALKLFTLSALLPLLSACPAVQEGIDLYYAGDFAKAVERLEPMAKKYSEKFTGDVGPGVHLHLWKHAEFEKECRLYPEYDDLLRSKFREKTELYYTGWMAYVGSLWAIKRDREACTAICVSMKPVTLHLFGCKLYPTRNPFESDFDETFWPESTQRMRSWWIDFNCSKLIECKHADGATEDWTENR